jgi:hypothetical protein
MGIFIRLVDYTSTEEKRKAFFDMKNRYNYDQQDFTRIPGSPIAYWVSRKVKSVFSSQKFGDIGRACEGIKTGDNDKYIRYWFEIDNKKKEIKWFLHNKGGSFRKWYGNNSFVVNWKNNGYDIKHQHNSTVSNLEFQLRSGVTWTYISSSEISARYSIMNTTFNNKGPMFFSNNDLLILGVINSLIGKKLIKIINPTLNISVGNISSVPFGNSKGDDVNIAHISLMITISKSDWDLRETSWDFLRSPLITNYSAEPKELVIDENLTDISWPSLVSSGKWLVDSTTNVTQSTNHYTLATSYKNFTTFWTEQFKTLHNNEEELNRIFIDLYELQDELTPDVPFNEITILQSELEPNALKENKLVFKKDEILKQFVSYAVGCIFGRYSLDKDGLILANAGEGLEEYVEAVVSGQWLVDSIEEASYDSKKLSGFNRLAESDGSSRDGLSRDKEISQRGTQPNRSKTTGGSFDSIEYSGGSGTQINPGVSSFLINCPRFKSGSRDANPSCPALRICNRQYSQRNFKPGYRSNTSAQRLYEQSEINHTDHSPLTTNHCLLSTLHFFPDKSGILPITDEDDFTDDLPNQFKTFLKASFGPEKYQENLRFVEEAIGKEIRSYFLKDFYKDHVKRYKKRPIYWMISSPSGAFRALIYLHRYTKDTISIFLNDYLRPYQRKLEAKEKGLEHIMVSVSASGAEKTKAQKRIDKLRKDRKELELWERDVVYPLATQRIELDLDDGVKVNYGKLGSILEKVKGLNG